MGKFDHFHDPPILKKLESKRALAGGVKKFGLWGRIKTLPLLPPPPLAHIINDQVSPDAVCEADILRHDGGQNDLGCGKIGRVGAVDVCDCDLS